ncbi:hypothetical protein SKAU_G00085490 [Synaphobranchus kaupii]|uniref:Uncharacterized protein n=1 Tax=Synaphobranchus kaupii TaxID=118154 RepID=A0A9Q1J5X7_SYNKA|nr:hypothetical protein SKAU_G00085490 [Synaphobranchus kaupii]
MTTALKCNRNHNKPLRHSENSAVKVRSLTFCRSWQITGNTSELNKAAPGSLLPAAAAVLSVLVGELTGEENGERWTRGRILTSAVQRGAQSPASEAGESRANGGGRNTGRRGRSRL